MDSDKSRFAGMSALVVDDSAFMRRLVCSLLRQFGFTDIREAADGSAALRQVTERRLDVVVCDWMMEPTDGYAFLQSLRHHDQSTVRSLPVIMLTAVATQNKVQAARDAGVTEYLVKPISSGKLHDRLLSVFARPRSFVETETYVGPDRRRRDTDGYAGDRRRATRRSDDDTTHSAGLPPGWDETAIEYKSILRQDLERLNHALSVTEANAALEIEDWRVVHRIAHDLKGQAPTFGYVVVAAIASSLERLIRPALEAPQTLTLSTARRIKAARTHAEALALIVEQEIGGRSVETDALIERLSRAVNRVHREAST